jgi:hypothetical protein
MFLQLIQRKEKNLGAFSFREAINISIGPKHDRELGALMSRLKPLLYHY